jgi:serine/threonine protein kinase
VLSTALRSLTQLPILAATPENTLLALAPISLTVPITIKRMTPNMMAYSATSWHGHAKVLDFGLARMAGPASLSAELPTASQALLGTVVGTLPYMSPEQLRGECLDYRSDIF